MTIPYSHSIGNRLQPLQRWEIDTPDGRAYLETYHNRHHAPSLYIWQLGYVGQELDPYAETEGRTYYSSHTAWAQFLEDMGRRVRLEDFEQVLDLITPAAAA